MSSCKVCLVTGSAGFIGFHLTKALLQAGHRVCGIDSLNAYYDPTLKRMRRDILQKYPNYSDVVGRIESPTDLRRVTDGKTFDVAYHFAAQAGVRYSLDEPQSYLDSNVQGSWQVLEGLRQVGVKHLVLASTSSVYGASQTMPYRESDRIGEPLNIYAATKTAMEAIAYSYASLYRIPTTVLRFFTVFGPWGRPDMALFKFTDAILKGEPIKVHGNGDMRRDFTFVEDLVRAALLLAEIPPSEENRINTPTIQDSLSQAAPYRIVNIGRGEPIGLLPFIEAIEQSLGKKALREILPMQMGEMQRTFAQTDLLQALTGYLPDTSLDTGVRAFVSWYLNCYKTEVSARHDS
jgi:UDP-glucuronate 4-epimerase